MDAVSEALLTAQTKAAALRSPANSTRFSLRSGSTTSLREPDANGAARHWILEIHCVDRVRQIGGFYEELLTVDA